jgi:hypothetical protein
VSSARRNALPQAQRARDEFDAQAANSEMVDKLQRNSLRRRARAQGLELRHSAYGYSLVDAARRRIDGRNDLTLDEVAARLEAPHKTQR